MDEIAENLTSRPWKMEVIGPFRVVDPLGKQVVIAQKKEAGLLAMLAASPNHSLSREGIASKLWPNADTAQAKASVRQALHRIGVATNTSILNTTRATVALNRDRVTIDMLDDPQKRIELANGTKVFCEGLYVQENEFMHWLEDMRDRSARSRADEYKPVVQGQVGKDSDRLQMYVLGPFRVTSATGIDLTPRTNKAKAMLAMLALSPSMSRPRKWIVDKLWSGKFVEHGMASLRQALREIRISLGEDSDVLIAERLTISLAQPRIRVDLLVEEGAVDDQVVLLEGLDAHDPEFEDWLRQERAVLHSKSTRATLSGTEIRGVLINCRSETSDSVPDGNIFGEVLGNQISENISEQVRAWRQTDHVEPGSPSPTESDVVISTQIVPSGDRLALFVKAVHWHSARILYSKLQYIDRVEDVLSDEVYIARMVFEAADQILDKLPHVLAKNRPEARSTALSRLGLFRMFSFDHKALREAYGLMQQAFEYDPNVIYQAWRSLIRITQMMEWYEADRQQLMGETVALYSQVMQSGELNGLVYAILSKVRATALGDTAGAIQMAEMALELNPANAFALQSLSEGYMLAGDLERAFKLSSRARQIARSSPFRHYWDTSHSYLAIACNRPLEGIAAGEAAVLAAPRSRPAHRHLLSLYALQGEFGKARLIAEKLSEIEPNFSLDQLVNDDSYPMGTLRQRGLLEPIKALL